MLVNVFLCVLGTACMLRVHTPPNSTVRVHGLRNCQGAEIPHLELKPNVSSHDSGCWGHNRMWTNNPDGVLAMMPETTYGPKGPYETPANGWKLMISVVSHTPPRKEINLAQYKLKEIRYPKLFLSQTDDVYRCTAKGALPVVNLRWLLHESTPQESHHDTHLDINKDPHTHENVTHVVSAHLSSKELDRLELMTGDSLACVAYMEGRRVAIARTLVDRGAHGYMDMLEDISVWHLVVLLLLQTLTLVGMVYFGCYYVPKSLRGVVQKMK